MVSTFPLFFCGIFWRLKRIIIISFKTFLTLTIKHLLQQTLSYFIESYNILTSVRALFLLSLFSFLFHCFIFFLNKYTLSPLLLSLVIASDQWPLRKRGPTVQDEEPVQKKPQASEEIGKPTHSVLSPTTSDNSFDGDKGGAELCYPTDALKHSASLGTFHISFFFLYFSQIFIMLISMLYSVLAPGFLFYCPQFHNHVP